MAVLPPKLHYLKSIKHDGRFGTLYNEKSYIVTFTSSLDVLHVSRNVSNVSQVYLEDYKPSTATFSNEVSTKKVELTMDADVIIHIRKDITIEWDWEVETEISQKLFSLPLAYNIGLIIPYKKVDETPATMTFRGYVVDPIYNIDFFRQGLSRIDI